MASEDMLLLGVALIIVVNRLWAHTGLRSYRLAYALVQTASTSDDAEHYARQLQFDVVLVDNRILLSK